MLRRIKCVVKRILGRPVQQEPELTPVDWYRKCGAVIGEDVELIECSCNWKDATCLEIGNHVTCVYTHFLTHDASPKKFIGYDCNKIGRIVIGDYVFVGLKSIILPNVHIGSHVVIGAGSVVTKDIPDNSVAVGNPAKVICSCDDYINKHRQQIEKHPELVYWNTNRYEMSPGELKAFNQKIDGEIVYFMER